MSKTLFRIEKIKRVSKQRRVEVLRSAKKLVNVRDASMQPEVRECHSGWADPGSYPPTREVAHCAQSESDASTYMRSGTNELPKKKGIKPTAIHGSRGWWSLKKRVCVRRQSVSLNLYIGQF